MGLQLPDYIKNAKSYGALDLEIAGEGERVELSDGRPVSYNPPAAKPVVPDWTAIKSIRHLFFKTGYEPYPAWLYHPSEKPKLVADATEAAAIGVCYRKASLDEKARYSIDDVWDWEPGCEWRATPYPTKGARTIDPYAAEYGKEFVSREPNRAAIQNSLIVDVTAAVVAALKTAGPAAPASVDPKQWDEFLAFQAFKQTQATVTAAVDAIADSGEPGGALVGGNLFGSGITSNALSAEEARALYEDEAGNLGIKVDGRWSLDRLKSEVEKAQKT